MKWGSGQNDNREDRTLDMIFVLKTNEEVSVETTNIG